MPVGFCVDRSARADAVPAGLDDLVAARCGRERGENGLAADAGFVPRPAAAAGRCCAALVATERLALVVALVLRAVHRLAIGEAYPVEVAVDAGLAVRPAAGQMCPDPVDFRETYLVARRFGADACPVGGGKSASEGGLWVRLNQFAVDRRLSQIGSSC